MATKTIQIQPKTIQGNISSVATQFIIENCVGLDGLAITQADIGGVNDVLYGTFEPNTIREEAFSAKIISVLGTAVTFECTRGLLGKSPYGTGGIAYAHDAGSKIVFSNNPNLFNKFIAKDNTEVVTGDIQVPPPVGASSVVPRSYVNAEDGAINAVIAALDAANVKLTGNQTIAGVKTFSGSPIVPAPTTDFQASNKKYIDDIAIAGSPDSSTSVKGIGRVSVAPVAPTDPIFVGDNDPRVPTQAENDALVGTGTPSSSNKYVTQDYFKFGNGSDGNVTISSPTTLTRDMYYNNLTVTSTLTTAGYKIFVANTINGAGTIDWGTATAGSNASGASAGNGGSALSTGTILNIAGGNGGVGSASNGNGSSAGTASVSIGVNGSTGGNSGSAGGAIAGIAGAGGTASVYTKAGVLAFNTLQTIDLTSTGSTVFYKGSAGSSGGGGGGGSGGQGGGGGGAGASGGGLFIVAKVWAGTFTIKAVGGNGGNGANGVSSNGGGGGGGAGGGGGWSMFVYGTKTWTGSYILTGGTAGTFGNGIGTGNSGSSGTNGTTGTSYEIDMATLTR